MHKSLSPAHKINSLYAFDALSRAARSQVNKHSLTGDLNTEPGNCATFLLKIEGVLDGLFQDMLKADHPEAKVSSLCSAPTDRIFIQGLLRVHIMRTALHETHVDHTTLGRCVPLTVTFAATALPCR